MVTDNLKTIYPEASKRGLPNSGFTAFKPVGPFLRDLSAVEDGRLYPGPPSTNHQLLTKQQHLQNVSVP